MKNAHVLITGATGFVGQAVLEKLLACYPTTRISLLVRPRGALSAEVRVTKLLRKACFTPWRESVGAAEADRIAAERVTVISGDLGDVPPLPGDIDVVVHSASTVSFDPPIDEAFAANVDGPVSLYEALLASGSDPHVVHVSTCYVAGMRKGVSEERSLEHHVDRVIETARALGARTELEAASRRPAVLGPILERARAEHRRAGAQAVAEAAEEARATWVHDKLVRAGRLRSQSLGWPDVYTFTKALGERVAEDLWGRAGHRLSVVRPTVIESSFRHPYPGWIDGFKVADPLIAAYGRGMLPEFPALADTILDIIPVDHVVNAILAVAATPPEPSEPNYYQVASGIRNPLRFGRLLRIVRDYFSEHPLKDDAGSVVQVAKWSFPFGRQVERSMRRREWAVDVADRAVGRLPATNRSREWLSGLYKAKRDLGTLRKFSDLYQPYTQTEVIFDDAHTRALHEAIPAESKELHGFDVTEIDWEHYLQDVHIPNVPGLTRSRQARPTAGGAPKVLPQRTDVLAVFDMHGTVAAANLLEHYVWVSLATGKGRALADLSAMVASSPTYLQAEHRDRGDFIRNFMRRYAGVDESELREVIASQIAPRLRARLLEEAVARIAEHRAAGHRTLLITGQVDVFVEPLADLFDEIAAGSMEKDAAGLWTGYLATSPLVDEARVAWLQRYARDHHLDLSASYAYGDTYADRPWLEIVGHPSVVNPDTALYRYARSKRWPVLSWTTTADRGLTSIVRSLRPVKEDR
ncbi:HAD-IB family hydrolase [Pseudactinotalea sp. HY160]|uniref:HAD-IB family hydrolase n=1 Tax=Pseudactinotalea sp. HY160 TaxID=2654490 RepID=UPI00128E82C9|nr:HAD-IB family hydrolase [Pseudactinotalea sp. HY160]MPV49160.1 HAD-IB family hydrolase [Pseudactinotalea sp. HY160]